MTSPPVVKVLVATYRRPDLLADLLSSLEAAFEITPFSVVVVDNDEAASASGTVSRSRLPIDYVVEPAPGIAAARNAGLDRVESGDDFIVFVDDDERVDPQWLRHLLATAERHDADVVSGPVISVFAPDAPGWLVRGGFLQRARSATGSPVRRPATNNTLVRTATLRSAGHPRFDERFSMSGGSDTEFFWRLDRLTAVEKVFCDQALVWEDVPSDRATWRFVWRRGVRAGGVTGRLQLREVGRARMLAMGIRSVVFGAGRVAVRVAIGRGLLFRDFRHITNGVGWIGVVFGRHVVEYARP